MSQNETTYNNWTNWSTWIIHHVFANDEYLLELQERMRKSHDADDPITGIEVKIAVLANWELVSGLAGMSTAELQLTNWDELGESWSDDWFNPVGPEPPAEEPGDEHEGEPEYKLCGLCGVNTYPPGRVVARCDACIEKWRRYEAGKQ